MGGGAAKLGQASLRLRALHSHLPWQYVFMSTELEAAVLTRSSLVADLRELGLGAADAVMIHAAFSKVGRVVGGPDALVDALLEVVGPDGTLLSYQDWELSVDIWDAEGRVLESLRDHVPPFDPATARPARDHGIIAATIGTRPGVVRSGNPGASVAALGVRADEFAADHPLDYGYGEGSPLARLVEADGKVVMVGAPLDTMTLLHHAEHLADLPNKRRVHIEYPLATSTGVTWRMVEEFDTSDPVVEGPPEDFFRLIVEDYLATGAGRRGEVGQAPSVLVDAPDMTTFAVKWLEERYGKRSG
jgi:aminoglycoside 3-N-acetyltransferase